MLSLSLMRVGHFFIYLKLTGFISGWQRPRYSRRWYDRFQHLRCCQEHQPVRCQGARRQRFRHYVRDVFASIIRNSFFFFLLASCVANAAYQFRCRLRHELRRLRRAHPQLPQRSCCQHVPRGWLLVLDQQRRRCHHQRRRLPRRRRR